MDNNSTQDQLDEVWAKLKTLNEILWNYSVPKNIVLEWLENFQDPKKNNLLYLLSYFTFFNKKLIESLCERIYKDLYEYHLLDSFWKTRGNKTASADEVKLFLQKKLNQTRFVPLGNPSESSSHILYTFRQINQLKKTQFSTEFQAIKDAVNLEYCVFVDDLCGSGNQAKRYTRDAIKELRLKNPHIKIFYFTMIGNSKGLDFLNFNSDFDIVDCVMQLDDSYKIFSNATRYFDLNNKKEKKIYDDCLRISKKHGEMLMKIMCEKEGFCKTNQELVDCYERSCLGFDDGQLLIGFEHNTPDNTLPIIWFNENENNWMPIFRRYNKIYK